MKYLSEYMEERQTKAFDKAGAFFAFGKEQLEKGKAKSGITDNKDLTQLGAGLICPKATADTLIEELNNIYKECIEEDIKDNGLNAIIRRELNNHEAYYTRDISSTVEALQDYPVSEKDILNVFNNKNYELTQEQYA